MHPDVENSMPSYVDRRTNIVLERARPHLLRAIFSCRCLSISTRGSADALRPLQTAPGFFT